MKRRVTLLTDCLVGCMILLVPVVFTSTHTHTIVSKEVVFQNLVWMLLPLLALDSFLRATKVSRTLVLLGGTLLLWFTISALWIAPHPRSHMEWTRWLCYVPYILCMAVWARDTRRFHLAVFLLCCVLFAVSGYGILQAMEIEWFFEWDPFSWDNSDIRRVGASFGNPDFFANFLISTIPLVGFSALAFHRKQIRYPLLALLAAQLTALYFTYSRGAQAALFITLLLMAFTLLILNRMHNGAWIRIHIIKVLIAVLLIVMIVSGLWITGAASMDAWIERFQQIGQGKSSITRLQFYQAALEMISDAPLVGHGLGLFDVRFPAYRPEALGEILFYSEYRVEHAHNELLQIITETGTVGLFIYLALFVSLFAATFRLLSSGKSTEAMLCLGLSFAILAMQVHNLFTVALRYTPSAFLLWLLVGLLWARCSRQNTERCWSAWMVLLPLVVFLLPYLSIQTTRYHVGDWLIQAGKRQIEEVDYTKALSENRDAISHALLWLHKGKELSPAQVESYFYLGLIYNRIVYDYPQGRQNYEELDALYPNFTSTRLNLGINALDLAEMLGSPNKLRELLGLSPSERLPFEPFEQIALNTIEEVKMRAETGIEGDPGEPAFSYILARAYLAMTRFDEAANTFEEAIEKARKRSEWQYRIFIEDCQRYVDLIRQMQTSNVD